MVKLPVRKRGIRKGAGVILGPAVPVTVGVQVTVERRSG
jgi:hypothetical protein